MADGDASRTGSAARLLATARAVHARARAIAVDQLAAGTAYFGFLALVPLLLLATAVAGFVLDDVDAQRDVAVAITSALPGLEAAVEPGGALDVLLSTLVRRRGELGLVGAVSLLLVALGVVVLAGSVTSGLASGLLPWLPGPALRIVTFGIGAASDVALFLVAYRVLHVPAAVPATTPAQAAPVHAPAVSPWRVHLPGALLGAAGWTALKVFGATFVGIRLQSAGAVYGTLAGVATVLVLLYLMARMFLTGAVLSAVFAHESTERSR